jgi:hypothetical protein
LIKRWTKEDVQRYHNLHYRPDNVILFVIGDVDVQSTVETIKQKFGHLQAKLDTSRVLAESGEYPAVSMREVNRHFPPVVHRWSCEPFETATLVPQALISPPLPPQTFYTFPVPQTSFTVDHHHDRDHDSDDMSNSNDSNSNDTVMMVEATIPAPKIFTHELLQGFSFHLFAKRPIEPITSMASLRREVMRRMALSALQIRFNVQQRQDPLFTFVDFNQLNWPREGCAVCSLDLTTDTDRWQEAVTRAVLEIRRLGHYGLTDSELGRYKQAVYAEAAQAVAQSDQAGNEV